MVLTSMFGLHNDKNEYKFLSLALKILAYTPELYECEENRLLRGIPRGVLFLVRANRDVVTLRLGPRRRRSDTTLINYFSIFFL